MSAAWPAARFPYRDLTGLMPSSGLCRVLRDRFGAGAIGRGVRRRHNLIFSA